MSKEKADTPAKGGKGMVMMLGISVAMLCLGGGGAFALVRSGVIGGIKKHEDNLPKLIRKGDEDPFAPKKEAGKDGDSAADIEGDGGSPYITTYFTFPEEFTSNLRASDQLIQVSIACSTHRDGRVIMWLKKHELAIRSAMLAVLADTPEQDASTIPGKANLQKRLTAAINKVLVEQEGFGGVDNVYFKSFLVQ